MAKKTTAKKKGQKLTPSKKKGGSGLRAAARSGAGGARTSKARRNTGRVTAGARTPKGKASRKKSTNPPRPGKTRAKTAGAARKKTATVRARSAKGGTVRRPAPRRRAGGTGMERELDQTPETGRSVKGPTNPMPTKRSTGTAAGAGGMRRAPGLERERRQLRELEESVPSPPSSLNMDRSPSAARSGRRELAEARRNHNETSPVMTGGDVDADWEDAYSVGDEAPGGDNPTPDQDRVDDIGKALGVEYQDNEELKAVDKIADRDRHRWELDPASAEDYKEHLKVDEDEEEEEDEET
jgi:hypothetical protein